MISHGWLTSILLAASSANAFVTHSLKGYSNLHSSLHGSLSEGDAVLLLGPGFLQLNIAKAAKAKGLRPVIVAPQKKIESFKQFVNDNDLIEDAT